MTEQPPQDPQQPGWPHQDQPPQDIPSGPAPGWYPDPAGSTLQRWWDGRAWAPQAGPLPGQQAGPRQAAGQRSSPGGGHHWVRNILAGIGALVVAGVIVSILSHIGSGGSSGTTDTAGGSSNCTTNSCIVTDAEGLKGTVAKDNSVMTKVTCREVTVKQVVSGTYTVHCTATYSDGSVWGGIASVLTAQGNIEWEATSMISQGSGS